MLLVGFILFAGSIYFYLQNLLLGTLDDDLTDESEWVLRVAARREPFADTTGKQQFSESAQTLLEDHFSTNPRNYVVMLASADGTMLFESENWANLLPPPTDTPSEERVFFSRGSPKGNVRVCVARHDPYLVQVAYPEHPVNQALTHLLSIFALLVPIVLLFSVSGGWLFATLALRPIDQITEMANRISASNLAERIPGRAVPDEIGRLITTINHMIERLQRSFNQIREFSLNIAHELRTPLTILKGESELAMTKELSPEEARQLANTYLEETVRLSRIVDDLLTLAKADAGQMKIQQVSLRFEGLVGELYEDAQLIGSSKGLTITLERNDPVTLMGDSSRLRQLLRNLVMNAIQYTPAGGTIRIASKRDPHGVEVSVQDTGIGIDAEDLPKIFQAFYRSDEARAHSAGGSGLGLAISRWIAQAHGGSIDVTSSPGNGSTFRVVLPLT